MHEVKAIEERKLLQLSSGEADKSYRIVELAGGKSLCRKLREMGIRENMEIRIILNRKNMVCLVGGSRFALSHLYAACIFVESVES